MCPYGISDDDYRNFLLKPKKTTFTLKDTDIVPAGRAELLDTFGEKALKKGFELDPPMDIEEATESVRANGSQWDQIILETYRREGRIVYRELDNGAFEAVATVPEEDFFAP